LSSVREALCHAEKADAFCRAVVKQLGTILDPASVRRKVDRSVIHGDPSIPVDVEGDLPPHAITSVGGSEYVIKEALVRGVPTIGYNQFFHDSGALMSFIISYRAVGKRVAQQVENILGGRPCARLVPNYKILVNVRIAKKLGLSWGNNLPERLEKD